MIKVTANNKNVKNTDFLLTSYVLDYGDNYHKQEGEPSSELERDARKIRRRYRNQHEYLTALATYNEYMSLVIEKHGGKRFFKLKLKAGQITDFIPHKPRMKNTKLNRTLEKYGVVISEPKTKEFNGEGLVETAKVQDRVYVGFADTEEEDKIAEKMIDQGLSLQKTVINSSDPIDYLEAYFSNKRNSRKSSKTNYAMKQPSLKQLLKDDYQDEEDDTMDDIVYYGGNMMNRDSVQQLALMEELNSLGWNSLKIMKSKAGNNSRITKILKSKQKKAKKDKKKKKQYNSFMVNVMGDNDYDDFGAFEEDMLNFTSANIFK